MVLVNHKISLKKHPIFFFWAKFHILEITKKISATHAKAFFGKKWPKVA
jgi:hypothetical protein